MNTRIEQLRQMRSMVHHDYAYLQAELADALREVERARAVVARSHAKNAGSPAMQALEAALNWAQTASEHECRARTLDAQIAAELARARR